MTELPIHYSSRLNGMLRFGAHDKRLSKPCKKLFAAWKNTAVAEHHGEEFGKHRSGEVRGISGLIYLMRVKVWNVTRS